jgi:hypothetical protein
MATQKENKTDWKRHLNYRWVTRNFPFFLFLSALAVLYIYNGHYADKTARNINKVSRELKELQYEYKTLKGEMMFRSKQSELAKAVAPLGLKEATVAPYVLKDKEEKGQLEKKQAVTIRK